MAGRWQQIAMRLERCFRRLGHARAKTKLTHLPMVLRGRLTFKGREQPWRIGRPYLWSLNRAEGVGEQRMIKRKNLLGLAAAGASVLTPRKARAQDENLL